MIDIDAVHFKRVPKLKKIIDDESGSVAVIRSDGSAAIEPGGNCDLVHDFVCHLVNEHGVKRVRYAQVPRV